MRIGRQRRTTRSAIPLPALAVLMAGLICVAPAAHAQQGTAARTAEVAASPAFQQGRQLYETNCAVCHQPAGTGVPPDFPALAGNAALADLTKIASIIRNGRGKMLAFPQLSETEIAALATFARNAWGNSHGAVTAAQVGPILAGLSNPVGTKVSVWSGVYTEDQNQRGAELHSAACAQCHGLRLNGAAQPDQPPSPAIARVAFLRKWSGQSVSALFGYIRHKMPPDAPNTLTDQQAADAIAHMLSMSGIPDGTSELPPDPKALEGILIEAKSK
jgi:mono/diheme cytochrome c family protein